MRGAAPLGDAAPAGPASVCTVSPANAVVKKRLRFMTDYFRRRAATTQDFICRRASASAEGIHEGIGLVADLNRAAGSAAHLGREGPKGSACCVLGNRSTDGATDAVGVGGNGEDTPSYHARGDVGVGNSSGTIGGSRTSTGRPVVDRFLKSQKVVSYDAGVQYLILV